MTRRAVCNMNASRASESSHIAGNCPFSIHLKSNSGLSNLNLLESNLDLKRYNTSMSVEKKINS